MKPSAKAEGDTRTASEPSKLGRERKAEGGATAPAHTAEQALQDECGFFTMSGVGGESSAAGLAPCSMCAA